MKQSEKLVLETLRKTTLAYLSETEYSALQKAVETEGIINLTGVASKIVKSAVLKHASHDQSSHGSWAGSGRGGGKYIQDMSLDDQKEFTNRMTSAKSYEEQRKIIDEFKERVKKHASHDQSSHGSWAGGGAGGGAISTGATVNNSMLERGKKALEGRDYDEMMRDYDKMEAKWRKKLSGPYDPENEEYGDPQDLAQADFYRKYGAFPMDVQYYAGALPNA